MDSYQQESDKNDAIEGHPTNGDTPENRNPNDLVRKQFVHRVNEDLPPFPETYTDDHLFGVWAVFDDLEEDYTVRPSQKRGSKEDLPPFPETYTDDNLYGVFAKDQLLVEWSYLDDLPPNQVPTKAELPKS